MPEQQLLRLGQVAEFLQVCPKTVYRLATSGELLGHKVGSVWRFHRQDVLAMLHKGGQVQSDGIVRNRACETTASA